MELVDASSCGSVLQLVAGDKLLDLFKFRFRECGLFRISPARRSIAGKFSRFVSIVSLAPCASRHRQPALQLSI